MNRTGLDFYENVPGGCLSAVPDVSSRTQKVKELESELLANDLVRMLTYEKGKLIILFIQDVEGVDGIRVCLSRGKINALELALKAVKRYTKELS